MTRTIHRLMLMFVAVFALCCGGVLVYHLGWEWPRQRCEARGDWWDWRGRTCAHPVLLSDLTGRTIEEVEADKAKAAAEKAATEKSPSAPAAAAASAAP